MPENSNRGRLPDAAAFAAAMGMGGGSAREPRFQRVSGEVPRPTVVVSSVPSQSEQRKTLVTAGPTPSIPLSEMLERARRYRETHVLPDTSGPLPRTRRETHHPARVWSNPKPESPKGVDDPSIFNEAVKRAESSGGQVIGVTGLGPNAGILLEPARPGEISSSVRGADDTETLQRPLKKLSGYRFIGNNVTVQEESAVSYYLKNELVRDPDFARFYEESLAAPEKREAQIQALFKATTAYAESLGYDISDRLPADVVLVSPETMRDIRALQLGVDNSHSLSKSEIPAATTWGSGYQIIFYTEQKTIGDTLETLQHEIDHAVGLSEIEITDSELISGQSGYALPINENRPGTEEFRQFNETIVQLMTLRKRATYWQHYSELREYAGIPNSTVYFSNLVTGDGIINDIATQVGVKRMDLEKKLVGGYFEGDTEQLKFMLEQTYGPEGVQLVANWREYGDNLKYGIEYPDAAQILLGRLQFLRKERNMQTKPAHEQEY